VEIVDVNGSRQFWAGRRVFVTGATGMVGSWLVKELLGSGAHVVALVLDLDPQSELVRSGDLQRCAVVNGRLEDLGTLERALTLHEIDTVFHLGAQTIVGVAHRAPHGTLETNVRGTYNLLDACRRHADLVQRVVVASSDKAYGESDVLPYTEESPLAARHPYEVSKAVSDLIAQSYYHTYGLPVTIARCGNIYGGGDLNWSRIVPGTIRSLLRDERPVLRSDGTFVRDYLYVRDAAHAYVRLAERVGSDGIVGNAFNFSDEAPLTALEVVEAICARMDKKDTVPVVLDSAVGEIHDQVLSAEKARSLLGWKPAHDLEAGLEETIAWYSDYLGDRSVR
jgi:CDP-glucose 4,6-dehydratase